MGGTEILGGAPIRAIVGRFHAGFSRAVIEEILRSRPFEHCAIISPGMPPDYYRAIPEKRQVWFNSGEVRNCEYAGVRWHELEALDEDLLSRLRECEAIFMEMVSRLEWKRRISYAVRKRWYLRHLRFWNDYITRHNINLYLSAWVPHEIPDIIIYELCKFRKIPVIYFGVTSIRDTSFVEYDWEESAAQLQGAYEKLQKQYPPSTDPLSIPLEKRLDERYRGLVMPQGEKPSLEEQDLDFSYATAVSRLVTRTPLKFLWRALNYLTPQGIARAIAAWQRQKTITQANAFYDAHAVVPDLQKSYVYMPLSFQPEATTVPLAGGYADQVLIAQMLHATLPAGVMIYVKEHPRPSSSEKRNIDYYRDFLDVPRVRLVSRSFDTFALREHCRAVATTAGTAGFEAAFRGKPVLMFGHCYYQYAPGVHRIRTVVDCRKAVHSVFVDSTKPTPLECRLYLKAVEQTCVHGVLDPWCFNVTHLTVEENAKNCSQAILRELASIFGN
jgi:hypothetical protein